MTEVREQHPEQQLGKILLQAVNNAQQHVVVGVHGTLPHFTEFGDRTARHIGNIGVTSGL